VKLHKVGAELYIPDGLNEALALKRTTSLGIAAHQDDLEIMAYDGILKAFGREDAWFTGVVVTNGQGSPQNDFYTAYDDQQIVEIRKKEQKKAALIGEYAAQFLLDYSSVELKEQENLELEADLRSIILATKPQVIYTHNPADKHETHVATMIKVIKILRTIPPVDQPQAVYGCEVWRDLDWLLDQEKVIFNLEGHENLAQALLGIFDSQISSGKRYDLAIMGRRRANATFNAATRPDTTTALGYAMDLTPLIYNPILSIAEYTTRFIQAFATEVAGVINKFS